MTPRVLLAIFTVAQLVNYFDRGVIGGELVSIAEEPGFELEHSEPRQGALQSGFVIGFMVAAPVFAGLAHRFSSTKLIAAGMFVWCLSSLLAALAPSYEVLLVARITIGVGEASFAGLAPAYIDDVAPPAKRTVWLSIFFAATAVGQALGYGVSGAMASALGWRSTFYFETLLMAPFVVIFLFVPPPRLLVHVVDASDADVVPGSIADYRDAAPSVVVSGRRGPPPRFLVLAQLHNLLANPTYVSILLGYSAWMFVIGCLGVFLPTYVHQQLGLSKAVSSIVFGAVTVLAGIFGTAAGGWAVDGRKGLTPYERNCFSLRFAAVLIALGGVFCTMGAAIGTTVWSFFPLLFVGEFLIFMTTGPVNAVSLACVDANDRSMAMSAMIFGIHLLGDLPSPVLVGQVMQTVRLTYYPGVTAEGELRHDGDRWVITGLCTILLIGGAFWGLAARLYASQFRPRTVGADVVLDVARDDDGVVELATAPDTTDEHSE